MGAYHVDPRERSCQVGVRPTPGRRRGPTWHSAQVSPADLDVPILGQLASAQLPLGHALEARPLKVVRLDAALGGGPLRQ